MGAKLSEIFSNITLQCQLLKDDEVTVEELKFCYN